MTTDELNAIEARNDTLYRLYNACAASDASWKSDSLAVSELMRHVDAHFPGRDVCLLLKEARAMRADLAGLLSACKQAMHSLTAETETEWQKSQAYAEAPYHFLWQAIAAAERGGQ